jgi:hypothetical protein
VSERSVKIRAAIESYLDDLGGLYYDGPCGPDDGLVTVDGLLDLDALAEHIEREVLS